MRKMVACMLLLPLLVSLPAHAQKPAAPATANLEPIRRFLTADTVLVARFTLGKPDVDALTNKLQAWAKLGLPDLAAPDGPIQKLSDLRDALAQAGADELYAVMSSPDQPPMLIVPLRKNTVIKAVLDAFGVPEQAPETYRPGELAYAVVGPALVLAEPQFIEQAKNPKTAPRPDLQAAIGELNVPIQVVIAPTPAIASQLKSSAPLPAELGGASFGALAGVSRIRIAARTQPYTLLYVKMQCQNPQAAKDLKDALDNTIAALRKLSPAPTAAAAAGDSATRPSPDGPGTPPAAQMPVWFELAAAIAKSIQPVQATDSVSVTLDPAKLDALAKAVMPSLGKAIQNAKVVASGNNIRLLLRTVEMNLTRGEGWPADLAAVLKVEGQPADFLANPRFPAAKPGYIYVKPATKPDATAPGAVLIYENYGRNWGAGINVGFVDGVVLFIKDEADFKQMLKQGRPPELDRALKASGVNLPATTRPVKDKDAPEF